MKTEQGSRENNPDRKPGIAQRVFKTLDTPLNEILFPARKPASNPETNSTTHGINLSEAQLFEPLIKPTPTENPSPDKQLDVAQLSDSVSFKDCVMASAKWAWRASPARVILRTVSSMSNALIPYAVGIAGAKTVDALVNLSMNPQAEKSVLFWFGISAGLGLISQVTTL